MYITLYGRTYKSAKTVLEYLGRKPRSLMSIKRRYGSFEGYISYLRPDLSKQEILKLLAPLEVKELSKPVASRTEVYSHMQLAIQQYLSTNPVMSAACHSELANMATGNGGDFYSAALKAFFMWIKVED